MPTEPARVQGAKGFRYDAGTDEYMFEWNVDKSWKNTCRVFVLGLADGTTHNLAFQLRQIQPPHLAASNSSHGRLGGRARRARRRFAVGLAS